MRLKQGDTIGFYSPSTPITVFCPKRTERSMEFIKGKGFQVLLGKLAGKSDFYRSGSISDRAEELNELLRNEDVKCVMSVIGGMNSNSLLPYLDYDAIKSNPKIVVGFSDVTAILLAIYAKTGITTFYGPSLVPSFGELPPFVDETFGYFKKVLIDDNNLPYVIENPKYWTDDFVDWETQDCAKQGYEARVVTLSKGVATGRLIGGNLETIAGIWGTEYMPAIKSGDILLIEDTFSDVSKMEKRLSHFKLAGVFDKVAGIIVGKHEKYDDKGTGRKDYDVLMEIIGKTDIPIIGEYCCSHVHPMITLPIGGIVTLNADSQTVTIESY